MKSSEEFLRRSRDLLPLITATLVAVTALLYAPKVLAEDPQKLEELRDSYGRAKERALAPLNERYIEALKRLQKEFMDQSNLGGANAIDREIKKFKASLVIADEELEKEAPSERKEVKALFGAWSRTGQPKVYIINPDGSARHGADVGKWLVRRNVLNVRWENGYEMDIELGQNGEQIEMTGFSPGRKTSNKYLIKKVAK